MSACAFCFRFTTGFIEQCQFPLSDQCRLEQRLEDMAYAVNASKDGAA